MSVSILEVLNSAGYTLDNRKDCEWILAQNDDWNDIYNQADDWIDEDDSKPCEHEDTDIETIDNTEEYELTLASGNPNASYYKYDQEWCNNCGATRRLPEGEWTNE